MRLARGVLVGMLAAVAVAPATAHAAVPPVLESFSPASSDHRVGDAAVPGPVVTLSQPVVSDTIVTLVSSDPAVTVPPLVTVLTGQSSATVLITCPSPGPSTLTASMSGVDKTAIVRCLAAGSPIVSATPVRATAVTGHPLQINALVDALPAVNNPDYYLSVVSGPNAPASDHKTGTGSNGPATLSYTGANPGIDQVKICLIAGCSTSYQTISVTWVAPQLTASAANLAFGSVRKGVTSPAQTLTFTNPGTVNTTIASVDVTGGAAADYKPLASDTCSGATVAPGGQCSVGVQLTSSQLGARDAALTINSDATAINVPLTGTGVEPAVGTTQAPPAADPPPAIGPAHPRFLVKTSRDKRSGGLLLTIQLPADGAVAVSGKSGKLKAGAMKGSGKVTKKLVLKLKPSAAGKAALKKRKKLPITLTVVFTPSGGGVAQKITLKTTFVRGKR